MCSKSIIAQFNSQSSPCFSIHHHGLLDILHCHCWWQCMWGTGWTWTTTIFYTCVCILQFTSPWCFEEETYFLPKGLNFDVMQFQVHFNNLSRCLSTIRVLSQNDKNIQSLYHAFIVMIITGIAYSLIKDTVTAGKWVVRNLSGVTPFFSSQTC